MATDQLPERLEDYFDSLISQSHYANLRGQARAQKIDAMLDEFDTLIVKEWIAALNPTDLVTFNTLKQYPSYPAEELSKFLEESQPDLNRSTSLALQKLRARYVGK